MRLIGIGLLAFLLAGIGLSLSQSGRVQQIVSRVLQDRLQFETSAEPTISGRRDVAIRRAFPSEPMILTGFPAYQSAQFYLPVDARPLSGVLQIDITGQALAGVEGILRIVIANNRRAEILIRPGDLERSVRVELTEYDIAQERLVVSFSLQGAGPHAPCGIDEGIEVIVEIETTSAVHLALEQPLDSDHDTFLASGRVAQIALPLEAQAASLLAAARLQQAGMDVRFANAGLGPADAEDLVLRHDTARAVPRFAWSDIMADDSAIYGLRRFHRSHSWRIRYDMVHAVDRRLPGRFDLALELGHLPQAAEWQVIVTLNGRLVHQDRAPGGPYNSTVELQTSLQDRANVLEVELRSTYSQPGECTRPPDLFAELNPQTRFVAGVDHFDDPLLGLMSNLASGWHLEASDLTVPEATVFAALLAELPMPESAGQTRIVALPRGSDLSALAAVGDLLLFRDADGTLMVLDAAQAGTAYTSQAVLLIQPGLRS